MAAEPEGRWSARLISQARKLPLPLMEGGAAVARLPSRLDCLIPLMLRLSQAANISLTR